MKNQPQEKAASAEAVGSAALLAVLEPVLDWYQSDEHPERDPLDILRDIVADLQSDRADALAGARLAPPPCSLPNAWRRLANSWLAATAGSMSRRDPLRDRAETRAEAYRSCAKELDESMAVSGKSSQTHRLCRLCEFAGNSEEGWCYMFKDGAHVDFQGYCGQFRLARAENADVSRRAQQTKETE